MLHAAIDEFAAHGYAGARIDRIAQRAGANKQLIYYYFGDKEDLYRAVADTFANAIEDVRATAQHGFVERVAAFTRAASSEELAPLIRLDLWASLEGRRSPAWIGGARLAGFVDQLRQDQADGVIPADLDPELLMLALIAITTFPRSSPGAVEALTGLRPDDDVFRRRFEAFTTAVARRLTNAPAR